MAKWAIRILLWLVILSAVAPQPTEVAIRGITEGVSLIFVGSTKYASEVAQNRAKEVAVEQSKKLAQQVAQEIKQDAVDTVKGAKQEMLDEVATASRNARDTFYNIITFKWLRRK